MKTGTIFFTLALATHGNCFAVDLSKDTADAFDRYIAATETRLAPRFRGDHFLGVSDSPDWRSALKSGTIAVVPTQGKGMVSLKGGLIQDWAGSIFVPGATLSHALTVVQDYEHHKDIYKPEIAEAKIRSSGGGRFEVYLRIVKTKLWISDVLNSEHEIRFSSLDSHRAYSRAASTRIAEVADAGKNSEHELPVGKDRGLLWRIYGYWFFEESDGGVFISCQSITLTRDLPFLLEKLLGPILRELPAEAVRDSLEQTRAAILKIAAARR